ncbi:nucleoside 2-deoxyribosyltransferase [Argonema galeatum]|uniref:nucleoside 2-deoxyribosyltransferase n=1 Tax=Argonema galeatum TaxID=2942762 RepID=UPI002011B55A|nr:nucleoside 2-deoxyribosyltransferase [Argonema galeatum]MCL1467753.1 nucleoside 2-deoxyribosyltransferase [Argonema galeatum A003/A1]
MMNTISIGKVYISGPLTGIEQPAEIKAFYEAIALVGEEMGFQAYVPHVNTDPINNPDVTPRQVFETDKNQVSASDLVIAYVGHPSLGVGMELAYAETNSIPIILVYEKGKVISRFPRGIPTVIHEVQFYDYEDALTQLKSVLQECKLRNLTKPLSVSSN